MPPLINPRGDVKILVVDCGLKHNQIRCLIKRGAAVQVCPWNCPIEAEMDKYDGLFLTNGPGDPKLCGALVANLESYMKIKDTKPIFGICMGHQILARAAGLKTYRLKYGNRGHNQPCILNGTKRCFITSQNHGYAVDVDKLPDRWEPLFTNANDQTNEGLVHREKPIFSVQFHPEHRAGPQDLEALFDVFLDSVRKYKNGAVEKPLPEVIREKLQPLVPSCPVAAFRPHKVLVLGSGGLTIGQAGEFDYCGSQALKALKDDKVKTVLMNPNIATSQTTKGLADKVYFLPITLEYVTQVIKAERPDGILLNFGGQVALNCGIKLSEADVLNKYNVAVLGTPVQVIVWTEDRQEFAMKLSEIGYKVAPSAAVHSVEEALEVAAKIGYPVLVRAAYSLGGLNSGFAETAHQLKELAAKAFGVSSQLMIDKSFKGWKELEYEVVRDVFDNCITVCNMENIDPLGIHTGESMVVAPSQTLSNDEYNMLRTAAVDVIRHLGVVGECNIQYALSPYSGEFFVIEVNARLSRSSALASKCTGYPLAYIAAKLAMGYSLAELRNPVTGTGTACFEPSLDYCVVKIPRWDLRKFPGADNKIGSAMKSIGEGMAIGRSFEEAFQKALRTTDETYTGFDPYICPLSEEILVNPTDKRVLVLATALAEGYSVDRLHDLTKIDRWFLAKMKNIIDFRQTIIRSCGEESPQVDGNLLLKAKKLGFCDKQIAAYSRTTEPKVRELRELHGIHPWVKQIDTVAGEWPARANYLYTTYHGAQHDVAFPGPANAVAVLGSGVYRIGSSVEFDCCAVGCLAELRRLKRPTIMINCNPETVSTDYDESDRLYFEELSFECVMDIYQLEEPAGIILAMGGQLPNNMAMALHRYGVKVLGSSPESIDSAENRFKFSRLLDGLKIGQPEWQELTDLLSAKKFCERVGYPCLIRPSYVLSGAAMLVAYSAGDLEAYLGRDATVSKEYPVVISKFIENAKEIDVDAVAREGDVLCCAVSVHVEDAGVHSGDATLVTPPQNLDDATVQKIHLVARSIAEGLDVNGPFNLQLLVKDGEVRVIELNLRVSRSFPFVSKTHGFDFVVAATRVALGESVQIDNFNIQNTTRIGVKASMFSFSRLTNADVSLGVEMRSTGEVAGFGENVHEALLKALLASGFRYPRKGSTVFVGISSGYHRKELTESIQSLIEMGFRVMGNKTTAKYYITRGIEVLEIEQTVDIGKSCSEHRFDLVISIPMRKGSVPRLSLDSQQGHQLSRAAADFDIPLITDFNMAKLFVESIKKHPGHGPTLRIATDCVFSGSSVRLPGLIDVGLMLEAESLITTSSNAVSNGVTMTFVAAGLHTCSTFAWCDFALVAEASTEKTVFGEKFMGQAFALELPLNGQEYRDMSVWRTQLKTWQKGRPICVESSPAVVTKLLLISSLFDHHVHFRNVCNKEVMFMIKEAKAAGLKISCDVLVYCLFFTDTVVHECFAPDSPSKYHYSAEDQKSLWDNIVDVDCFSLSMNAKDQGLGGMGISLLLSAVSDKRLTWDDITSRLYDGPKKIFGLTEQENTYVEVDLSEEWLVPDLREQHGKEDMRLRGKIQRVVLRGVDVFMDGYVIADTPTGQVIYSAVDKAPPLIFVSGGPDASRPRLFSMVRSRSTMEKGAPGYEDEALSAFPMFDKHLEATRNRLDSQGRRRASAVDLGRSQASSERSSLQVPVSTASRSGRDSVLNTKHSPMSTSMRRPSLFLSPSFENLSSRRVSLVSVPTDAPKKLPFLHVVSAEDFCQVDVKNLMELAKHFQSSSKKNRPVGDLLCGKILVTLVYGNDTLTAAGFDAAMKRLGGSVIVVNTSTSSVQKGESLSDTVKILTSYGDMIVVKQGEVDAVKVATWCGMKPFISAGDPAGEDVVQSLSDVFTIWDEFGTLKDLTVTFTGNLNRGSAIHSLIKLLALSPISEIRYVEISGLGIPCAVQEYVEDRQIRLTAYPSLSAALPGTNVLYVGELYPSDFIEDFHYTSAVSASTLSAPLLNSQKPEMRTGVTMLRILHLQPRSGATLMLPELEKDHRVIYFGQAENGFYMRQALLFTLLKGGSEDAKRSSVSLDIFRRRKSWVPVVPVK
ncbi:hypothetical protein RvY_15850-2 [Ramazzottius varieornatus]|nr:hypothetical protein RvY_15850-2 [Ramazzottius varieornatus]